MKRFSKNDIEAFESRYRANFVNSLSGAKALQLVGTKDFNGQENLSIINSAHHIGANPPLMGYIQRPHTVEKHTYENIKDTGFYTFSNVLVADQEKAHQTSAKFDKSESEFDECGFEVSYTENGTPYVQGASLVIELRFVNEYEIKENGTFHVIGEIQAVYLDPKFIFDDGTIDLEGLGSMAGVGLNGYVELKGLSRYAYAKPHKKVEKL